MVQVVEMEGLAGVVRIIKVKMDYVIKGRLFKVGVVGG